MKKIEKATQLCGVDIDDLVDIDTSAERMLAAITRLELAIQSVSYTHLTLPTI